MHMSHIAEDVQRSRGGGVPLEGSWAPGSGPAATSARGPPGHPDIRGEGDCRGYQDTPIYKVMGKSYVDLDMFTYI